MDAHRQSNNSVSEVFAMRESGVRLIDPASRPFVLARMSKVAPKRRDKSKI
jgi:hypothetical protein